MEDTVAKAAELAEEISKPEASPDLVTLSNGIRLGIRSVPGFFMRDALRRMPAPEVPKVFIDERNVWEENESDPAYIAAFSKWLVDLNEVSINLAITVGTSTIKAGKFAPLVEHLPEDIPAWDDDVWVDMVQAVTTIVIEERPQARYLAWLRYVALERESDVELLSKAVGRKSGILSRDVEAALQTFPGGTGGAAAVEAPVAEERSPNGHHLPVHSGDGVGDRSA